MVAVVRVGTPDWRPSRFANWKEKKETMSWELVSGRNNVWTFLDA